MTVVDSGTFDWYWIAKACWSLTRLRRSDHDGRLSVCSWVSSHRLSCVDFGFLTVGPKGTVTVANRWYIYSNMYDIFSWSQNGKHPECFFHLKGESTLFLRVWLPKKSRCLEFIRHNLYVAIRTAFVPQPFCPGKQLYYYDYLLSSSLPTYWHSDVFFYLMLRMLSCVVLMKIRKNMFLADSKDTVIW